MKARFKYKKSVHYPRYEVSEEEVTLFPWKHRVKIYALFYKDWHKQSTITKKDILKRLNLNNYGTIL